MPSLILLAFVLAVCYVDVAHGDCHGSSVPLEAGAQVTGVPKPHTFVENTGPESVENVFFLSHAETCAEARSLAHILQTSSKITIPQHHERHEEIAALATNHSLSRKWQSDFVQPGYDVKSINTPLKALAAKERRDLMLAVLQLATHHKLEGIDPDLRRLSSDDNGMPSILDTHLPWLEMDIMRGDVLPNYGLRHIASELPCLEYAPEQNMPRFPTAALPQQPNDLRTNWRGRYDQWHLVGAREGEAAGTNALDGWACFTGQEVKTVIAVVDTGCSMHPDLEHNLCKPQDACAGYDFGDNTNNPYREPLDCVHGTTVSGTIAAVTNNKFGLAGICWGCHISCHKIYNTEYEAMGLNSILKALDNIGRKGIKISNHSYLAYGTSSAEMNAHVRLRNAGHLAIIAAGNDGCSMDHPYQDVPYACKDKNGKSLGPATPPAYALDNFIVVGAINRKQEKAYFTNWSPQLVHLMAPGEALTLLSNTLLHRSGVAISSGTSFSAPIVAGVAGLIWSRAPHLTAAQVKALILNNVDTDQRYYGLCQTSGRLNIEKIMRAMADLPCGHPDVAKISTPTKDHTADYYDPAEVDVGPSAAPKLVAVTSVLLSLLSFLL